MAGKICLFPIMEIEEMIKDEIRERYPKASETDIQELYRRQIMIGSEGRISHAKEQQYRDDYMADLKDKLINFTKSESFKTMDDNAKNKLINKAREVWSNVDANIEKGIVSLGLEKREKETELNVQKIQKEIDDVKKQLELVATPENISASEYEHNEYAELQDKLSKLNVKLNKAELDAAHPYDNYVDAMTWMEKSQPLRDIADMLGSPIPDSRFALLDMEEVYQRDPLTKEELEKREIAAKQSAQILIDEEQRKKDEEAEKEFDVLSEFGAKDVFKDSLALTGVKANIVNQVKWRHLRESEHAVRTLKTTKERVKEHNKDINFSMKKISKLQKQLEIHKRELSDMKEYQLPKKHEDIKKYIQDTIANKAVELLKEFDSNYGNINNELLKRYASKNLINEDGSINVEGLSNFLTTAKVVALNKIDEFNLSLSKEKTKEKKIIDSFFDQQSEPYKFKNKDQEIQIGKTIKVSSDRNLDLNNRKTLEKIVSQHGIDIKDTDKIITSLSDEVKADASRKIEISVFRKTGLKEIDYKIQPKEVSQNENEIKTLTKQRDNKIEEINNKFSDMLINVEKEILDKYKSEDNNFTPSEDHLTGKYYVDEKTFEKHASKFRENPKLSEREVTLKTLMEIGAIDSPEKLLKIKSKLEKLDKFRSEVSKRKSSLEEKQKEEIKNIKEKINPKINSIKKQIREKQIEYRKENQNLIIKELKQFVDTKKYDKTQDLLSSINISVPSIKFMVENDLISPKDKELLNSWYADERTMKVELSGKGLENNFYISNIIKDEKIFELEKNIETANHIIESDVNTVRDYLSKSIKDSIKSDDYKTEENNSKYLNNDNTINDQLIKKDVQSLQEAYKNVVENKKKVILDLNNQISENNKIMTKNMETFFDSSIEYGKLDKKVLVKNFTSEDFKNLPEGFKDGVMFIDKNIVPTTLGSLDILKNIKWDYNNLKQALELGILSEKGERQFMFDGSKKDKDLFNQSFRQQDAKSLFKVEGEYNKLSISEFSSSLINFRESAKNATLSLIGTSKHVTNVEQLKEFLKKVTPKEVIDLMKRWDPKDKEFDVMSELQQRYVLQTSEGIDPFYIDTETNSIPTKANIITAIEDAIYENEGIFEKVNYEKIKDDISSQFMKKFIDQHGEKEFRKLIESKARLAQVEMAMSQNEDILSGSGWKIDFLNNAEVKGFDELSLHNVYKQHLDDYQKTIGNNLSIVSEYIDKVVKGIRRDSPESFDRAMKTLADSFNKKDSIMKINYMETTNLSKLNQDIKVHNIYQDGNLYLQADPLNGRVDLMWISHSEQIKNKKGELTQSFDQRKHNLISFFSGDYKMSRHDSLIDLFVEHTLTNDKLNPKDLESLSNNQKIKRIGEKIIADNNKIEKNIEISKNILESIKPSIEQIKNIDPSLIESSHYWKPKVGYTEMHKYNAINRINDISSKIKVNKNGELSKVRMIDSAYKYGSYKNIQVLDTQAGRTIIFTNDNVVEAKTTSYGSIKYEDTDKSNRLKISFEERDGNLLAKVSLDDSGYIIKTFTPDHPSYGYAKTLFESSYEQRDNLRVTTQNIEKTKMFEALHKIQFESSIDKLEKMNYNKLFNKRMKRSYKIMGEEPGTEEYKIISKDIAASSIKQAMKEASSVGQKNVALERAVNKFIDWTKANERIKDGQQMVDILQNVSRIIAGKENSLHDINYTVEKSSDNKTSFKIPQNEKFEMAKKLVDALVPIYGNKEGLPENKEDAIAAIIKKIAEGGSLLKTQEQNEKITKLKHSQEVIEDKDARLMDKISTNRTAIYKLEKDIENNNLSKYRKDNKIKLTVEEAIEIKKSIREKIKPLQKEISDLNEQRKTLADDYDKIQNQIEWIDSSEVVTTEDQEFINSINSDEKVVNIKDTPVDFDRTWVETKIKPSVEKIEFIDEKQKPLKEKLDKLLDESEKLKKDVSSDKIEAQERISKVKRIQEIADEASSLKADIYKYELEKEEYKAHINRTFSTGNSYREEWLMSMFRDNLVNKPGWWRDSTLSFKPGDESFKNIYKEYLDSPSREKSLERQGEHPKTLEDLKLNDEYSFSQLIKLLDALTHRVVESRIVAEGNENEIGLEPDLEKQQDALEAANRNKNGKLNTSVNEQVGMHIAKAMSSFAPEIINMIEGQNINLEDKILDNMTSTVPMNNPKGDAYDNNSGYECQA